MKRHPLVSIVIPVYRTEQYINQCVSSIQNQTYSNLEIILVDDGSPDGCPALCDQYSQCDSRFIVIHKENGGLSSARQVGIQAASGDYLMIVDSDDWIEPETVEICVEAAERDCCDCVMFAYVREYTYKSMENPLFDADFCYDEKESESIIHRRLVGPVGQELATPQRVDNLSSVCMKLYRIETARKGRFVSERIVGTSEDTVFNLYALDGCRISYLNRCMYHYRKDNVQSITAHHKPDLAEKWDVLYHVFEEYINGSGRSDVYMPAFFNRVACGMIGLGLNEAANPEGLMATTRRLNMILGKPLYRQAFSQLDTVSCPIHWKLFFVLCRHRMGFSLALLLKLIHYLRSRVAG